MKTTYKGKSHTEILHKNYAKALTLLNENKIDPILNSLSNAEKSHIEVITENFEGGKGVLTVLITSLVHKLCNPKQDIRRHQDNMKGGYSGRGIDTKYITPFMKELGFPAMSESGWLTRSLEQNLPYDLSYPGKITPKELKTAFLYLLEQIESHNESPEKYLLILFARLIEHREKKKIDLAKPTALTITTIINFLKQHFETKYATRGASRLPTLAIYAAYQCLVNEMKRFKGKILMPLEEHTSSDKSSGRVGDIEIRDAEDKVFEAVEIKHGVAINPQLIRDAYEKFKSQPIQRYYLLSTVEDIQESDDINKEISRISKIHGCQVIINGIYPSLKYYLRFFHNPYDFTDNYVENLKRDKTIKFEHKLKWNEIVSGVKR
ncbi:MAG TPA: DNA methyltransferase [Nitrospiraceae bacterium]|nr:DNA methyltransferase [Nitrospiraceae bacterium]